MFTKLPRRSDPSSTIRSNPRGPITAAQLRAARALLGWSAHALADRCGVSHSAISRAERAQGKPQMQARKLSAIRATLEKHGIEFLDANGVRLLSKLE
ncbi:MAG TPA: helix-turn-helix transcriptional regulator [Pseudolabrys sp.]|nr:helix-turn-helix transcriptional regulator [Pseudolabrys sp.]